MLQVLSRPGCNTCLVKQPTSVRPVGVRPSLRRGSSVTVAFKRGELPTQHEQQLQASWNKGPQGPEVVMLRAAAAVAGGIKGCLNCLT